jgi:hypothetical protein
MELYPDNNTVCITCNNSGHEVIIELSILQLAKIFGSDTKVISEIENKFGTDEYEDKCAETRQLVKEFPKIKANNKELEFFDNTVSSTNEDLEFLKKFPIKEESIRLYGEDIGGWNNEGIRIRIPKVLYNQFLANKQFKIIAEPFKIKLIPQIK